MNNRGFGGLRSLFKLDSGGSGSRLFILQQEQERRISSDDLISMFQPTFLYGVSIYERAVAAAEVSHLKYPLFIPDHAVFTRN